MGLADIIQNFASSPNLPPTDFYISPENTDMSGRLKTPFKDSEHYFLVQINEMYLSKKRQWFNKIMPMVYTSVGFTYGNTAIEVPYLVGPSLLRTQIKDLARDMIFRDTAVAGWYPYTGGKFTLTVLLCQTTTNNYLLQTLNVVEKISGLFSTNISSLVKSISGISKVVVDGFNELANSKDIQGLACFRQEFDAARLNGFMPGYYLLVDKPLSEAEKNNFFVKKNRLFYGNGFDDAQPYRDGDYVLFSLEQTDKRSDYKSFAFYDHYNKALEMASKKPVDDDKKADIADELSAMLLGMLQSPDMLEKNSIEISDDSYEKVKTIVDRNYKMGVAEKEEPGSKVVIEMKRKIREL